MQNRYVGDIGDYAKYSLLRTLAHDCNLGISWYLFPDENSGDGGHVGYLLRPDKWRQPDPKTFGPLRKMMGDFFHKEQVRGVAAIEESGLLPDATTFWGGLTVCQGCKSGLELAKWRRAWFQDSLKTLKGCDIVFADPDNGLKEREKFRPGRRKSGKSICEDEALALAANGRPVVVYHHNARSKGSHGAEVRYWQGRLGRKLEGRTSAVRWRCISPRTFFILNCTADLRRRAERWCAKWDLPKQVYFEDYPDGLGQLR